jgi:ligand-binding SRPBCC domain-containing protein
MRDHVFEMETTIPAAREAVFSFFSQADNLMRITPESLHFRIVTAPPIVMKPGTMIDYVIRLHGFPMRWRTLISEWEPPFHFVDEQVKGPYRRWIHRHSFTETVEGHTVMKDHVRYQLPFPPFGLVALPFVRREVEQIFAHRRKVIGEVFP